MLNLLSLSHIPDDASDGSDWTLDDPYLLEKSPLYVPLRRMTEIGSPLSNEADANDSDEENSYSVYRGTGPFSCEQEEDEQCPSWDYIQEVALGFLNRSNPADKYPLNQITYFRIDSASPEIMIKRVPTFSTELSILKHLDSEALCRDPWNPVVPIVQIVCNGNDSYIFMERLQSYGQPALQTVFDGLDLVRQLLQGMSFLHQNKIVHLDYNPDLIMMETGLAPLNSTWSRSQYPVRYYLVDFAHAAWAETEGLVDGQSLTADIVACGRIIERLFGQTIPELEPLTRKMALSPSTHNLEDVTDAASCVLMFEQIASSVCPDRGNSAID